MIFYWSIVDLQCCVSFCCTAKWISYNIHISVLFKILFQYCRVAFCMLSSRSLLEKAMATHSSTLAWKIPWTEEPGRLQSLRLLRVRHDWAASLSVFTFHFHVLEKDMATHSSILAWRIPGTGEPGGLLSMGSHRVGHDWSDLSAAGYFNWIVCFFVIELLYIECSLYILDIIWINHWVYDLQISFPIL